MTGVQTCALPISGDFLSITIEVFNGQAVSISDFPVVTMIDSAMIQGLVVRTPPLLDNRTDVTITGGVSPVTALVQSTTGIFIATVRLTLNATNTLVLVAEDETGATSRPVTLAVTHIP